MTLALSTPTLSSPVLAPPALGTPARAAASGRWLAKSLLELQLRPANAAASREATLGRPSRELAALPLSRHWMAGLVHRGQPVSFDALDHAGLSIRQAWDAAATNHIANARRRRRDHWLLSRPASWVLGAGCPVGVQLLPRGGAATGWLAHPLTADIVLRCAVSLTGSENPVFLAPAPGVLLALPDDSAINASRWARVAARQFRAGYPPLSATPLLLDNGFVRNL